MQILNFKFLTLHALRRDRRERIKRKKYICFLFFYSDPVMVSKTKGADKDDLLTMEDGRDGKDTHSMVS